MVARRPRIKCFGSLRVTELPAEEKSHLTQLRLLLEELCCELCWLEHSAASADSHAVRIDREYSLGQPGMFADIRVAPLDSPPYIVEVKFGYSGQALLSHLRRKYAERNEALADVVRIMLVVDAARHADWPDMASEISAGLAPGLQLEIWDECRIIQLISDRFNIRIPEITPSNLLDVRQAIDRAQGFYAFGGESVSSYKHDPLNAELLWHFGFSKLRHLRETKQLTPRDILPPGLYRGVVVLLADLCSFSSYVRDSPDARVVRESLTSFYSKSRYQIINGGGMLYQFVGDEVIGLFGVPEQNENYVQAALDTARSLLSIGDSVSHHWQRQIDRVQTAGGVHVGLAIGDIQIVSLRPFGRTHIGAIGDSINVAARLMASAESGDIVASNSFVQALSEESRASFREMEPLEARNVGRISGWKMSGSETRIG